MGPRRRGQKGPEIPLDPGMGTPRRPRPASAREAEASARSRYYAAKATETEMRNRVRAGELIEADEAVERWGRVAQSIRDAVLALPGVVVERGLVARDREVELTALVEHCLRHLAERSDPWMPPGAP